MAAELEPLTAPWLRFPFSPFLGKSGILCWVSRRAAVPMSRMARQSPWHRCTEVPTLSSQRTRASSATTPVCVRLIPLEMHCSCFTNKGNDAGTIHRVHFGTFEHFAGLVHSAWRRQDATVQRAIHGLHGR